MRADTEDGCGSLPRLMQQATRTPLNAIGGFAEALLCGAAGPLPAEAVRLAGEIVSAVRELELVLACAEALGEVAASDRREPRSLVDLAGLLARAGFALDGEAASVGRLWLEANRWGHGIAAVGRCLRAGAAGCRPRAWVVADPADALVIELSSAGPSAAGCEMARALMRATARRSGAVVGIGAMGVVRLTFPVGLRSEAIAAPRR